MRDVSVMTCCDVSVMTCCDVSMMTCCDVSVMTCCDVSVMTCSDVSVMTCCDVTRKFSSLTKEDHQVLFVGVEPLLSLSSMILQKVKVTALQHCSVLRTC